LPIFRQIKEKRLQSNAIAPYLEHYQLEFFAIGANVTNLLATAEYAEFSTAEKVS
jgi:hypothetical protein